MLWLRSVVREILGLFVDDGSFAIVLLVWAGVVAFVLAHVFARAHWLGPVFFAGLALILVESVLRAANRRPPQ